MISKEFLTNFIAICFVLISFFIPQNIGHIVSSVGLFALSGSITNQLAIHMLFEKVPFLYGSGVILDRFEDFKSSIKELIMEQFFTKEQLDTFFANEEKKIDLEPLIQQSDFSLAYDALVKTVMESSFGAMLGMFGGQKALEGLRDSFSIKIKNAVLVMLKSEEFNANLQKHLKNSSLSGDMLESIHKVVDSRLNELTPQMIKEMLQRLIKEHLSWLVVWGGVFGGLIGLISSIVFV